MGCGKSAAYDAPAAAPPADTTAPEPVKTSSAKLPVAGGGTADAPPGADDGLFMTAMVSPAGVTNAPRRLLDGGRLIVQIFMDKDWKPVAPEEQVQMSEHMAQGKLQFEIEARGQTYKIELNLDGPGKQTNVKSGKERKLRLVDPGDDDDCDGPGGPDDALPDASAGGEKKDGEKRRSRKPKLPPELVTEQKGYGPQSKRGGVSLDLLKRLEGNAHAVTCFESFIKNEERLCGEFAVFYHSYSFAALLYEVHAAVGAVLFRFRSQYASLPRILVSEFQEISTSAQLVEKFETKFAKQGRDHHPEYRAVALSVMCSMVARGPEASPPLCFISGYSCKDLSFRNVLDNVLESCYVPKKNVKKLADDIIALSEKHGLDVTQFGGKACKSGLAGHLLQIFLRRDLLPTLTYAALPYGPVDPAHTPISDWMNSNQSFDYGQARIIAHPKYFMQANAVRMYVTSADPTFHGNRQEFQRELTGLLEVILGEPTMREKAATGIYGGTLPPWWTSEDQREKA